MNDSVTSVDEHWLWLSANHPLPIVEMRATHIYNHLAEVDFRQSATSEEKPAVCSSSPFYVKTLFFSAIRY